MKRTTRQQFKLFEREVRRWADRFGFKDWAVYVFHTHIDLDTMAECEWNISHRQAVIRFNLDRSEGDAPLTVERIKRVAMHECAELLLCVCTETMRESRSYEFVNCETHKVIRVLENVLCGGKK
jgi:hypothetical protein